MIWFCQSIGDVRTWWKLFQKCAVRALNLISTFFL